MNLEKMTVKDCRGNESTTLFFVRITWLILLGKFIVAGMTLPYVGEMPLMGVAEFGIAVTGVLFIWTKREQVEKTKGRANA